jgi:hypothetical protein
MKVYHAERLSLVGHGFRCNRFEGSGSFQAYQGSRRWRASVRDGDVPHVNFQRLTRNHQVISGNPQKANNDQ